MAQKSNFIVRGGLDMSSVSKGLQEAQKQFSTFQKTISGSMKLVVSALGSIAIGSLIKDSLEAASAMESAMTGLTSIVQGQGRDINAAKSFLNDYVKDGLIPLTDAVTAYKNLVARGYNDEQIKNTLERLKDAASFGRQSSYSLGEAVKSATEGLKNENSILVDNAGVTKNVAKMWEEYSKTIGKSAKELTQQEKIQAEVNGIMKETQWQVGDAAKYTDTYQGRLSALNKILTDIKVNLGNAFMPIANVVIPILQNLGNNIANITSNLASFTQALFGKAIVASNTNITDTTQAIEKTGEAAEEAGKKASKAIAPFDEIINMGSKTSGAGATSTTTTTDTSVATPEVIENTNNFSEAAGKLKETLQPTIDALKNLWDAVVPFAQSIGKGFLYFVNDLKKVGAESLNGWIPQGINAIADGLNKIDPRLSESIGSGLGKIGLALGAFKIITGLGPWFASVGQGLVTLGSGLYSVVSLNPMAFVAMFYDELDAIQTALYDIMPQWVKDIWEGIWYSVADILKATFNFDQTIQLAKDMVQNFKDAFSGQGKAWYEIGGNIIMGILSGLALPLSVIIEPIYDFFAGFVRSIKDVFGIKSPAKRMMPYGRFIMLGVIEGIKQGWDNSWKSLSKWLTSIPSIIASAIGSLYDIGKNMVKSLIAGLKSIVIPGLEVPVFSGGVSNGGRSHSSGIGQFANGGFPDTGSLFVANESGPELVGRIGNQTTVANQDQIVEAISQGVYNAMIATAGKGQNVNVYLQGDAKGLFKAVKTQNDQYVSKTGRSAFAY